MRTKENMKRMVTPVGIAYWPYIGVQQEPEYTLVFSFLWGQ